MTPAAGAGVTSAARDLVYVDAEHYLSPPDIANGRVQFKLAPSSKLTLAEIAPALRVPGASDLHIEGTAIVGTVDPNGPGESAIALAALDIGPYQPGSFSEGRLRLKRRAGKGLETIEFIAVGSQEEEWRRFLAREVDLIVNVHPDVKQYLTDMPSVELVPFSDPSSFGFIFRVDHEPFADVRLRRAVSMGVRRTALARAVLGSGEYAIPMQEDEQAARALLAEVKAERGELPPIRLTYPTGFTDGQRAALVLEQQLQELGLKVQLVTEPPREQQRRFLFEGKFDVILMYTGITPMNFRRAITGSTANVTGYSNREFDRAAGEDPAAARAILERDVPMTPLFTLPEWIAIDKHFCGARPKINSSLDWLADVHVCAPGETE